MKVILEGRSDEIIELISQLNKMEAYYPITIPSTTPTYKWKITPWWDTVTCEDCTGTSTGSTTTTTSAVNEEDGISFDNLF